MVTLEKDNFFIGYTQKKDYALTKIPQELLKRRRLEKQIIANILNKPMSNIISLLQVHGDKILLVKEERDFSEPIDGYDGVFVKGLMKYVLLIMSADCLPIFFIDTKKLFYGAVHSGWRGTEKNIVAKMIDLFVQNGSDVKDLEMFVLPSICYRHYEVGHEFKQYFNYGLWEINDHYYLDLWTVNEMQAMNKGILPNNIFNTRICTFEDNALFSYRRDGNTGRNINFIYYDKDVV